MDKPDLWNHSFASENFSTVHPVIIKALLDCNIHHQRSYGNDDYTASTKEIFKTHFGNHADVYFTYNGTGANNFVLSSIVKPYSSVFCSDVSHLYISESTAPEAFTGCRLYPVKSVHGKIIFYELQKAIKQIGDVHHPQPAALTITQPTEYGTIYLPEEIKAISDFCKTNGLLLHVDGARYFNAAAALNVPLNYFTDNAGVDVLTLGGTKNGMMFGEAVIFFTDFNIADRRFHLKRSMQLASKMRYISTQFGAMLSNKLWYEIAAHSNKLAKLFESEIINKLSITHPVEANAVFVKMKTGLYKKMNEIAPFYMWNEQLEETRFIFSFDVSEDEIIYFTNQLKQAAKNI